MEEPQCGPLPVPPPRSLAATTFAAVAACSPPEKESDAASGTGAATATSAADLGGMDALVAAAKKEGRSTSSRCRRTGRTTARSSRPSATKYGIKVNSAQPDGSSQDEINAADQLKGQDKAPDVFDLGGAVATANVAKFAPYKVATWADIPDALKDANGTWVNDYGGYMSIGYDSRQGARPDQPRRPAQARVQGQGRAQRRPDPGRRRVRRRHDGRAGQRRLRRRHRPGRRLLRQAQEGRQLPAGRPDPGDHRVRPDPGRLRLGLPERRPGAPS